MPPTQSIISPEENDLKKIIDLLTRNSKFFLISVLVALLIAFLYNRYAVPVYKISASMLIREDKPAQKANINEYINTGLFGTNQNFQNELWVLKSSPVIEQTIENLDLTVNYFRKEGFFYTDIYKDSPFRVLLLSDHIQPVNVRFEVSLLSSGTFRITAKSGNVSMVMVNSGEIGTQKKDWKFEQTAKFGKLLETRDLAFLVQKDTSGKKSMESGTGYSFIISGNNSMVNNIKKQLTFNVIDKQATVIQIGYKSSSVAKGKDIVNEIMNVYSDQNLARKNHIAGITIDYIEKQLNEISDSLSLTENNLQNFRSSNQLLNVTEQATGISAQYMDLQNQLAELVTHKKYYDYVQDYLSKNDDFSNITVPASMGIQDPLLNTLMSDLIKAQAQRSNLIENHQEKNPMVQRLNIQIENFRKTITENISAVQKTTDISIDEMKRRIRLVEADISKLPKTQRQLGGIERKYRLNDAIYNYLLEKRAEAKITQASNLPDDIIIEPAKMDGSGPVSPNTRIIFLAALFLGLGFPFGYLLVKSMIGDKIEAQENMEKLTDLPVLGKIIHSRKKTNNVMFEFPKSAIAESYRALRTNIDYHYKGIPKKTILVTSCIEGEGKSFNALNLAMSYAQMGRRTLLVDFDLRKSTSYFNNGSESLTGMSNFLTDKVDMEEIILRSPHEKLDYIQSGPVPPNPVELLAMEKTGELIGQLKKDYDYILFDTPPLAQVTDAYLLLEHADIKVIIARYEYTLKKVFSLIMKDLKLKNINNTCIVLNDNKMYKDQYGYGYGYNKKQK
jgi:tyrosine-protein kinase Etk/Wzc